MANNSNINPIPLNLMFKFVQAMQHSVDEAVKSGLISDSDIRQFIETIEFSEQTKAQPELLHLFCRECSQGQVS